MDSNARNDDPNANKGPADEEGATPRQANEGEGQFVVCTETRSVNITTGNVGNYAKIVDDDDEEETDSPRELQHPTRPKRSAKPLPSLLKTEFRLTRTNWKDSGQEPLTI